jgi:hypothetical protein
MTVRTTKRAVTFAKPFVLGGFDEVFPAGTYDVETDEEVLDGISFLAYRKVLTLLHLPATSHHPSRTLTVDSNDLDAALERDGVSATAPGGRQEALAAAVSEDEADRRAEDLAEDEGMTINLR